MKLVFLGTPEFAVPSLEALVQAGHEVVRVYTQPDRPKGRGQAVALSPVKHAALRLGLDVSQPERIRTPEAVAELRALHVPVMAIVGYGQIIPQSILDLPPLGLINVHASLLPKYRGAAPIQWAVANGEAETGVTTMRIDAGLDTGGILLARRTEISPAETADELSARLARIGAELLVETLEGLAVNSIATVAQNDAEATLAPILRKENGRIEWRRGAKEIYNQMRGFVPWPGAYTTFRGQTLNIWKARPVISEKALPDTPGTLFVWNRCLHVSCGTGSCLELLEVQLQGRKRIPAEAFLHGQRIQENEKLGELGS